MGVILLGRERENKKSKNIIMRKNKTIDMKLNCYGFNVHGMVVLMEQNVSVHVEKRN